MGLARGCCHVYLDDVLVLGSTFEEHYKNLAKVFDRVRRAGLRLKPKKCAFAQESVIYLGHQVSAAGIQKTPEKLRAVREYPRHGAVKALRWLDITGVLCLDFPKLLGHFTLLQRRVSCLSRPKNVRMP